MKKIFLLVFVLLSAVSYGQLYQAMPQPGYYFTRGWFDGVLTIPTNVTGVSNISGGREVGKIRYNITDSSIQAWTGYQWRSPSGSGGGVSDFTSGDLSPLFTSNVATSTSTPALSFTLSNTSQYKIFGRKASGSGAPSYLDADSSLIPALHSENYYNTKYLPIIDFVNFTDIISIGDSYAGTTGITTQDSNFVNVFSAYIGVTPAVYSTGGATTGQLTYDLYLHQDPYDITKAVYATFGYNDLSSGLTAKTLKKVENINQSAIINQFLDNAIPANSGSVTVTGSWADTSVFVLYAGKANSLSGKGKYSASGTSYLEYTFSGDNIVVGYIGSDGTILGGSLEIYVDAVRVDSFSTNNQTDGIAGTDYYAGKGISCVKYFYGFGAGSHTVKVQRISGAVIVDYFGTLQTDPSLTVPIFISSGQKVPQEGWTVSGVGAGSNEQMNTINTAIKLMIEQVKKVNKFYPVYYIDLNKFTNFSTDFSTADYVHFNGTGHQHAATAAIYFVKNNTTSVSIDPVSTPDILPGDRVNLSQVTLPLTTNQNTGVFKMGTSKFFHIFPNADHNTFLGLDAGKIDAGTTTTNSTGIGWQALTAITTGISNTGFGSRVLTSMADGNYNTAAGVTAGVSLTSGSGNTLFGTNTMIFNSTGNHNVAIGFQALYYNEASANIGIGTNAGENTTSGTHNITIGTFGDAANATASGQLNIGNVLFGTGLKQDYVASATPTAAGAIGIGINTPAASAILDLTSTTKGVLPPRMTTTQMNAISSPATGLTIYNTTDNVGYFYNGASWLPVANTIASTYTPTLTNTTNVTSSTPIVCHYTRVGNEVTVTGSVTLTPTAGASAATVLGISLPIASNFAATTDGSGFGTATTLVTNSGVYIEGNTTSDIVELKFLSATVFAATMFFTFTYTVL